MNYCFSKHGLLSRVGKLFRASENNVSTNKPLVLWGNSYHLLRLFDEDDDVSYVFLGLDPDDHGGMNHHYWIDDGRWTYVGAYDERSKVFSFDSKSCSFDETESILRIRGDHFENGYIKKYYNSMYAIPENVLYDHDALKQWLYNDVSCIIVR